MHTHQVDHADLYFQYARSEGWSLEEGIVKSGSFPHRAGRRRRAVTGEKTAFAYSDDISLAALHEAPAHAAIGRMGRAPARPAHGARFDPERPLLPAARSAASLADAEKVALLSRLEKMARDADPRITQVMASLGGEFEIMLVARSDGVIAADVRPLVRVSLQVIAEENGRREQGRSGGGGRFGYEMFTDDLLKAYVGDAVRTANDQSVGARGTGGNDDRGARQRLARNPAARSGRTRPRGRLQSQGRFGIFGACRRARRGQGRDRRRRRHDCRPARIAQRRRRRQSDAANVLIEDGILAGYMQDSLNARLMKVRSPATAAANRMRACRCRG
jgi:TldD protein